MSLSRAMNFVHPAALYLLLELSEREEAMMVLMLMKHCSVKNKKNFSILMNRSRKQFFFFFHFDVNFCFIFKALSKLMSLELSSMLFKQFIIIFIA